MLYQTTYNGTEMKCIITLIGENMNHEQKCQIHMRGYLPIGGGEDIYENKNVKQTYRTMEQNKGSRN